MFIKKSAYKWTCAVQTYVVQGSTVQHIHHNLQYQEENQRPKD